MSERLERIGARLAEARRVWLFLDYDGTLADLAPTPDHIEPDPQVIGLVSDLAQHPGIRLAVVSGRRLDHLEKLIPVTGIVLAGTYGLELRTPEGEELQRADLDAIRPPLEDLKTRWLRLIVGRPQYFLEDKGWALALHARFAPEGEAAGILAKAESMAAGTVSAGLFRVLGGHKFLEIAPHQADKGATVELLLERYAWPDALPVYLGDDDKDEAAFVVIQGEGGIALVVGSGRTETSANARLESPQAARDWLRGLLERMTVRRYESMDQDRAEEASG